MSKVPNIYGGGARTNKNGLHFEQVTSLNAALEVAGYTIKNNEVYNNKELIGVSVPKKQLYTKFLEKQGLDYAKYNSKQWQPDEAFINFKNKTAYIIEKKFQNCSGSVDEKLPGCHFKKLEYKKLFEPLNYNIEYIYVFNDWFLQHQYRDTLEYIKRMGCHYFFNEIPLDFLNL